MRPSEGLTVFISSSIDEFKNARRRLKPEVESVGFLTTLVLEVDGARPNPVSDESLSAASSSDIYVGILGDKYSDLTIREYRAAKAANKPCFVYILNGVVREKKLEDFVTLELSGQVKYQLFRNTDELVELVVRDLSTFMGKVLKWGMEHWTNEQRERPLSKTEQPSREQISRLEQPAGQGLLRFLGTPRDGGITLGPKSHAPQWIRILQTLARTKTMSSKQLTESTGIYGAVLYLRMNDLTSRGLADVDKLRNRNSYSITDDGRKALEKWSKAGGE